MLGNASVKLMNFAPLIVCLALLLCLDRGLGPAELTGVRRVDLADRALVVGTVAASAVTGWLFVNVVAGLRAPSDPYPWAILLEAWNHPFAGAVCAAVLVLGLVALGRERARVAPKGRGDRGW